ncbi:MAG: helix-turn-helix transcriptional regulator, partial [Phycisphaeraceae bacterium]
MVSNMGSGAKGRDPRAEFGRRMRRLRHGRGWTLEQLAEAAGMHWTYLGSMERGERNVSLINIVRVARALGVGPEELVVLRLEHGSWSMPWLLSHDHHAHLLATDLQIEVA